MSRGLGVLGGVALVFVMMLAGAAVGGYLVWTHAPPVGGDWWFYVRLIASVIGALIGAKVGYVAGVILGGALMYVSGVVR